MQKLLNKKEVTLRGIAEICYLCKHQHKVGYVLKTFLWNLEKGFMKGTKMEGLMIHFLIMQILILRKIIQITKMRRKNAVNKENIF